MTNVSIAPLIPKSVNILAYVYRETPKDAGSETGCYNGWTYKDAPFVAYYLRVRYHGKNFRVYSIVSTEDRDLEAISSELMEEYKINHNPIPEQPVADEIAARLLQRLVNEFYKWYVSFVTTSN